jgi:2-iminobutanoate/2-iminopropanoate deaminase
LRQRDKIRPTRKRRSMKRFLRPTNIGAAVSGRPHGVAHGRVFKRLVIAGQIGVDSAGNVPGAFESQVELAFDNLLAVIQAAQLAISDLVKLTAYSASPDSLALYNGVYQRKMGAVTPISTYVEIAGLGDPRWLIAIEGEAIQESGD